MRPISSAALMPPVVRIRLLGIALAAATIAGCSGNGRVYTVPLVRKDFPPNVPIIESIDVPEAYYWVAPDGELNIAMQHHAPSLLGPRFDRDWQMSIVLEDLPAGSEKLYSIRRRAIRMTASRGGDHRRGQSFTGTVVIETAENGRLKGRFHAWVRQQRFVALAGWSPAINRAPMMVVTGQFEAVRDPQKGQAIRTATEADAFERDSDESGPTVRWLHSAPASSPAN